MFSARELFGMHCRARNLKISHHKRYIKNLCNGHELGFFKSFGTLVLWSMTRWKGLHGNGSRRMVLMEKRHWRKNLPEQIQQTGVSKEAKKNLLVDAVGIPLSIVVTGANRHDAAVLDELLKERMKPLDFELDNESITIYFSASGESRFSIPKIKRSDFSVCFPDFCFSNRKACDLCSPENLSGDHRKHRGECENSGFSPALQMDQFHLKISPKNEKADQRSGRRRIFKMVDHFFIFQKNSLHLKMANFSSLKRRSIFTSRKILREKLELHSASKKSLNIAKMVEKRFELPTSTHDLSYEKIRLADCHKIPIFF